MKYTREFINSVIKEFPNNELLHQALELGNLGVGEFLYQQYYSGKGISPEEIVEAFRKDREFKIKLAAKRLLRIKKLFIQWQNLQQSQILEITFEEVVSALPAEFFETEQFSVIDVTPSKPKIKEC